MSDIKNYRGGSQKTLNEINMSVVLDRIRRGDNVSRSSLVKELNLSFPTVSRIVETLIDKKYVYEVGPGESSGGKRPMILKFNAERSYVIGLGADVNFINILLSDLCGNVIKTVYESFPQYKNPKEMINIIVDYINNVFSEVKINSEDIAVISIGIPATINKKTGEIGLCPTIPDWEGIKLRDAFSSRLHKEVILTSSATLSLLGEVWKGSAHGYKDVVLVGIGTGIGGSIMVDGKIPEGANGSVGEIGYMYIDKNIDKDESYPFGQFEYLASNTALRRKGLQISFSGTDSHNIKDWINDESKKAAILETVTNLAYGIANLITILDPELVIIRGALFYESDYFFKYLKRKVNTLTPVKAKMVKSMLKENDVTFGAVSLAINYLDRKILSPFFTSS